MIDPTIAVLRRIPVPVSHVARMSKSQRIGAETMLILARHFKWFGWFGTRLSELLASRSKIAPGVSDQYSIARRNPEEYR